MLFHEVALHPAVKGRSVGRWIRVLHVNRVVIVKSAGRQGGGKTGLTTHGGKRSAERA